MSRQGPREIEAKLVIADAAVAQRLEGATEVAGCSLAPARIADVQDVYYDTASFALARRGWGLRVRREGEDRLRLYTLKGMRGGPGGLVQQRPEIEATAPAVPVPSEGANPGDWPPAVAEPVARLCGGAVPLGAVCQIRQRRAARRIHGPGGLPLGEMSVDGVRVEAASGGDGAGGPPVAEFFQLELELDPRRQEPEDVARLELLAVEIASTYGLEAAGDSKYQGGLRALAASPPGAGGRVPAVAANTPVAEALRALLWRCLIHMVLEEAEVRRGVDIEAVHDMRVAIRRGRSAIRTFGHFYRKKALRPVARGLRRTARALGPVRDMDVALDNLTQHARQADQESGPQETVGGTAPERDLLRAAWLRQRDEARSDLLAWLDSAAYEDFIARMRTLASSPGLGTKKPQAPGAGIRRQWQVRHAFPPAIVAAYEAVRAHEDVVDSRGGRWDDLHALRIDCKRLRYTLEAVAHLLGPDAPHLLKTLKRLQNTLGEMNDAVVAVQGMRAMSDSPRGAEVLAGYVVVQEAVLASSRRPLASRWRELLSQEYRETLFRAVARL